jgi:hypothetical protein
MNPDAHHPYHNLPWLERLTVHVPGYDESLRRGDRRTADRTLRRAIIHRLEGMHARLDEAVNQLLNREAPPSHVATLERIVGHIDRVIGRIRATDVRIESSYDEAKVGSEKAGFLHAVHLALFEQAEALVRHFEEPDFHHDRLAHLEADLEELERRLDEKALIYQKLD